MKWPANNGMDEPARGKGRTPLTLFAAAAAPVGARRPASWPAAEKACGDKALIHIASPETGLYQVGRSLADLAGKSASGGGFVDA